MKLEITNTLGVKATILNNFSVSGLEDTTHKATSWTLKEGTSIVWASLMDEENRSVMDFGKNTPRDVVDPGKTYTLEVQWVASNNQSGPLTVQTVTVLSELEYYLKQVYEGTASPNRIRVEGRVFNSGRQYQKGHDETIDEMDNIIVLERRVLVDGQVILDWKRVTY